MRHLYITADIVGEQSGGGQVTCHEALALRELDSHAEVWDRRTLNMPLSAVATRPDPWCWDDAALWMLKNRNYALHNLHVHFYSGTFSSTVAYLKEKGAKVSYTAAAHSVEESRKEHELLGLPFDYPHLNDPALWQQYLGGYRQADLIICPSRKSKQAMQSFGCTQRIEVIPHGVTLPKESARGFPQRFTVGYLGAVGPDKGLIYLIKAWSKLDYPDALLILAGKYSDSGFVHSLLQANPGGKVSLWGWVQDVSTFYDAISIHVQPSVTEGWGCEVVEAMAHGRLSVCSDGAGAADAVHESIRFPARDWQALADRIDFAKVSMEMPGGTSGIARSLRKHASEYAWPLIRERYRAAWNQM